MIKKILMCALLAWSGICAAGAQEKTTTANVPLVVLNNGVEMPRFGLGTFMQGSNETCKQSCLTALKAGYRQPMPIMTKKAWGRPSARAASPARKSG